MKKMTIILVALASLLSCTKQETPTPMETFAAVVGTRSESPLELTLWESDVHDAAGFYSYIYFQSNTISLFYGRHTVVGVERWTDNWDGDYSIDGCAIQASLTYPNYGEDACINALSMLTASDQYILVGAVETYHYVGQYTDDLEQITMLINCPIGSWK